MRPERATAGASERPSPPGPTRNTTGKPRGRDLGLIRDPQLLYSSLFCLLMFLDIPCIAFPLSSLNLHYYVITREETFSCPLLFRFVGINALWWSYFIFSEHAIAVKCKLGVFCYIFFNNVTRKESTE